MIVFSLSAVSADDLQSTDSGEVSGDVDLVTVNPWSTSGQLTYDIPSDADVKSATVYVNVYGGSAKNTHGCNANVSLNTTSGEKQIASEQLWIEDGSTDGTIYPVNNHTNKCYSDYQMYYDITDSLKGLNGSSITIKVDTFKMENKTFDGRIKLIALIFAYDDGDSDKVSYWLDSTQKWTKTNVTTVFATENITSILSADLYNIALSSADGSYKLYGELLGDPSNHTSGNYYQYDYWNVTDSVKEKQNTELVSINAGTGTYASLKNVLSLLKVSSVAAEVSFATEYKDTCFAATNNTLTVSVKSNNKGKYVFELVADGAVVNTTEIELDGVNETTLLLTDPTIRPADEKTVNGANNTKVTYAVNLKFNDKSVAWVNKTVPVLYNGNLGKDLAYNATYIENYDVFSVTGGAFIDCQNDTTYMGTGATGRTDVWNVFLPENSTFDKSFIYIAYNWDSTGIDGPVLNTTFNGKAISTKAHYRDQSNLGSYGNRGYGLFVYDVTGLVKEGENTLIINKTAKKAAVYPSTLIYFYNTTESKYLGKVYMAYGADLMSDANNNAGRIAKTGNVFNVSSKGLSQADLFIFAASAEPGDADMAFNGVEYADVFNGTSNSVMFSYLDISSNITDSNNISFVATGTTVLALNQMIATWEPIIESSVSMATEYKDTCYAATNNIITVNAKSDYKGKYVVELLADGTVVDTKEVALDGENETKLLLTDPTIRPADEKTVSGANNTKVTYAVNLKFNDKSVAGVNKTVPVLYNGNLGKDLEYNATYIEDYTVIVSNGGIFTMGLEDSAYMGTSVTNYTGILKIQCRENSTLTDSFLYIAYNWDSTGITGPVLNVTFNGNVISPKAHYRDQSNLGSYGNRGYGLFVYDVSGLAKIGNNTVVIAKEAKKAAVYPAYIISGYNITGSEYLITAYIAEGADLMSNANNNAGRISKTDSKIIIDGEKFINAYLAVIAAGAESGEGNIIFNGIENINVWNGTSNSVELFNLVITDDVAEVNDISFVATGGTILALTQMIITEKYDAELNVTISDAEVGKSANVTVSYPTATGKALVIVDGNVNTVKLDENGNAVYTIEEVTAGKHDVVVVYLGDDCHDSEYAELEFGSAILACEFTNITVTGEGVISAVLVDESGSPIANANVTYSVNGNASEAVTAGDGSVVIPAASNSVVLISFEGNDKVSPVNATITLKDVAKLRANTSIIGDDYNTFAIDYYAGERGGYFKVKLVDDAGKILANKSVKIGFNGKVYNTTTDSEGIAQLQINLAKAGTYTFAVAFLGDKDYNASFTVKSITVNLKKTSLNAPAKSYKASAKTKSYTVTLKTDKGSSIDGKTYMASGKTVKLTVNGKTYTAKTNAKGQATFKLDITKKGTYTANVNFAGDNTYKSCKASTKITIN